MNVYSFIPETEREWKTEWHTNYLYQNLWSSDAVWRMKNLVIIGSGIGLLQA